jgi:prepilin-type N-terminal cleavage/methylation domain-containing protein
MKRKDEGFTLIELLIVIVILGILAAVVVFAVNGITDRGEKSACKATTLMRR